MEILNHHQIEQKIRRLAIEILEHNFDEKEIILAGINNNGMAFAKKLLARLRHLSDIHFTLTRIKLRPANPISEEIVIDLPLDKIKNKVIIVVDDVANTGRTLFFATKPLMDTLPKRIATAVLVERYHKSFPINVDFVGMALATTLKENIDVVLDSENTMSVRLN